MSDLDDFIKAVKEGNLETPLGDLEVANDGDTRLLVGKVPFSHLKAHLVSICLADGGGFSSLYIDEDNWKKMKIVIDSFFLNREKS